MVAEGTPEEVCNIPTSYTGQYLKPVLARERQHTPESA
jgi:excinuclease ABC subunit A